MQEINRDKSLIKQNILNFLHLAGITKYEFYKNSGISRGTLDNTSGLTEENILKFLKYAPHVSPDWLLLGKGEMLKNATENSEEKPEGSGIASETNTRYASAAIPVYNVRNTAAMIALLNESEKMQPEDFVQIPNLGKCDGALYITSDSMYPLLKSGDIAVYKVMKDKENSLLWGELYWLAVNLEGEEISLLGYVQKSGKGEAYVSVRGYNAQHEAKDFLLEKIVVFAHVRATVRIN